MFCNFNSLTNKHFIFCLLQFIGSTAGSVSLCMSAYGLAANIGQPWVWEHYLITGCISTSIIVHAIKDSLLANPELLRREDNDENINIISV